MKFNGPKAKLSRRLGVPLTPKADRIMQRHENRPGVHGSSYQRRLSDYGLQLLEKQRLRSQYNVSERRLDAFVLRAGFVHTIFAARQVTGHGHFEVNGERRRRRWCSSPRTRSGCERRAESWRCSKSAVMHMNHPATSRWTPRTSPQRWCVPPIAKRSLSTATSAWSSSSILGNVPRRRFGSYTAGPLRRDGGRRCCS